VSAKALNKQSATGERYDLQARLVELSTVNSGYTMTQLAWLAAGGEVDADGFCQPAAAFAMTLEFFNAKRRGCEIARNVEEEEGRRPNARLVYGKALRNPYDFGGAGVYPLKVPAPVPAPVPVPVPVPAPVPAPVVARAAMPAELLAFLD
jgi:hypothetical protein